MTSENMDGAIIIFFFGGGGIFLWRSTLNVFCRDRLLPLALTFFKLQALAKDLVLTLLLEKIRFETYDSFGLFIFVVSHFRGGEVRGVLPNTNIR